MLHVGLDTVKLEGRYFEPIVKNGDRVKAGDLLMKFDIKAIQKEGFEVVTPIIITNSDDYELKKATKGAVKNGAAILAIMKKEV